MSTLAEIEEAVPHLSPEELAELERLVRMARRGNARKTGVSAFDLLPLNLGRMLHPLGDREEWYDEMLKGRVRRMVSIRVCWWRTKCRAIRTMPECVRG